MNNKKHNISVGKRLSEERRIAKIKTQTELSNKLNVSLTTVSRWEQDKSVMPSDKLILMGELGLDIAYILTGERIKNKTKKKAESKSTNSKHQASITITITVGEEDES